MSDDGTPIREENYVDDAGTEIHISYLTEERRVRLEYFESGWNHYFVEDLVGGSWIVTFADPVIPSGGDSRTMSELLHANRDVIGRNQTAPARAARVTNRPDGREMLEAFLVVCGKTAYPAEKNDSAAKARFWEQMAKQFPDWKGETEGGETAEKVTAAQVRDFASKIVGIRAMEDEWKRRK